MSESKIPEFPKLASFPEHQKLSERITALKVKRDGVEKRIREALASSQAVRGAKLDREAQARNLLAGDGALPDRLAPGQVEAGEYGRLLTEKALLDAAIALGEKELRALEQTLAKRCCAALVPHHRKIIEQLARKMVDVLLLARQEVAIFDALQAEGIPVCELTPSGGPSRPMFLGSLQVNPQDAGNIANWLRQLIEEGVLDARMAWLRDALALDTDPVPRPQPVRPEEPAPTKRKRLFYL